MQVVAAVVVVVVFGVAAVTKVRDRRASAALAESLGPLVPKVIPVGVVARGVIAAETAAAVLTAVPGTRAAGLGIAVVLFAGYAVGVAVAVRRGLRVACRCFGASTRPLGKPEAVRNAALAGLAGLGLLGHGWPPAGPEVTLVAAVLGAVLAVAVVRWDDLMFLFTGATGLDPRSR